MFTYKGCAKRLDDIDLPRIGARIGVGEDEIHAVLDVEAAGSGFDKEGRVKALYEPHIAYRLSSGVVRDRLVKAGLAYPKWGQQKYPKDSYPRILEAHSIAGELALEATSWGLGQVMGFNYKAAGYPSARAMVEAFADDEENHLDAMVNFIITNGLDDEIRRHDWRGFARGYNGSGYEANGYHTKLAAAFAKWSKIKDTPFQGGDQNEPTIPVSKQNQQVEAVTATASKTEVVHPPPAVIVSDVPLPKPGFWTRFLSAFSKRVSR
jgi:hypothetical protein